jgi:basic membrane lipoprotein Med (substrate-binding protein (PBP1-ABC) superfamily)
VLIPRRARQTRTGRPPLFRVVFAAVLALGLTVSAAACGGGSQPASGSSASSGNTHKLKVALLTPGLTNDGSFNQVGREACERLKREGLIDLDIREKMADPATAEPVIREYATKGYDLVIGHGIELVDPIFKVAKEFPKVHFTVAGGADVLQQTTANVETWTEDFGQQGYLAGYLAGKIKDVRTAGLVGGLQLPFILELHAGFKAGLKEADPSRTWKEVFTGSFDDVQKALEATTGLLDQGAGVVWTSGDGIGNGVAAAAARHQPKALTFGVSGDAGGLAKNVNVASVELDMYPTFRSYVDRVVAGTFGNKGYTSGLANKGLVLTPISEGVSDPRIPADLQAQADKLVADLASGAHKLPSFQP